MLGVTHWKTKNGRIIAIKINFSVIKNHRYPNYICPICEQLVPDLIEHAIEIGDDLHRWLTIMES